MPAWSSFRNDLIVPSVLISIYGRRRRMIADDQP
jgi:hypothetical protein